MADSKENKKTGLILKGFRIWAKQYHFRIPREMLRMYVRKFIHEFKNIARYGVRYFETSDPEQYAAWRKTRPVPERSKRKADCTLLIEQENVDLSMVDTEYVCILSKGCALYPLFGDVIGSCGDVIYFDHDRVDHAGNRFDPVMKPDFSYNTLRSFNYIGRCFVVKTELMRQFEGQEWNPYGWLLRLSDQKISFVHVSTVAYSDQKPFACEVKTLRNYLSETEPDAQVSVNQDRVSCTVLYPVKDSPLVSIIIPTRDTLELLKKCIDSIFCKTTYPHYEIVIADNGSEQPETLDYLNRIQTEHDNIQVIRIDAPFNYSLINNEAASAARGDYLVLLNNDTEVITPDWLEGMLGYAQRENVGSVGVKLYYEDSTIQHAGVIVGKGGDAGHRWYQCAKDQKGYLYTLEAPNDVACCTAACLMTARNLWDQMNGLNEELTVQYNDVDYGLRLLKAGYFNVFLPFVELYHYESKSRGIDTDRKAVKRYFEEVDWFKNHYADYIAHDPFYNDSFDRNYDYKLIAGTGSN